MRLHIHGILPKHADFGLKPRVSLGGEERQKEAHLYHRGRRRLHIEETPLHSTLTHFVMILADVVVAIVIDSEPVLHAERPLSSTTLCLQTSHNTTYIQQKATVALLPIAA